MKNLTLPLTVLQAKIALCRRAVVWCRISFFGLLALISLLILYKDSISENVYKYTGIGLIVAIAAVWLHNMKKNRQLDDLHFEWQMEVQRSPHPAEEA